MNPESAFTMESAVALIRELEPKFFAHNYHTALTGSVLYSGASDKDLDIVLYPHKPDKKKSKDEMVALITALGFTVTRDKFINEYPEPVVITERDGKRVDFFIFSS